MTDDRALAAVTVVVATPPLVAVRCPHCGNVLVRVSQGAAVEVRCLKCKTWLVLDRA